MRAFKELLRRIAEIVGKHEHDAQTRVRLAALDAADRLGVQASTTGELDLRELELLTACLETLNRCALLRSDRRHASGEPSGAVACRHWGTEAPQRLLRRL